MKKKSGKKEVFINDLERQWLDSYVARHGEKLFRVRQIFKWVFNKNVSNWDEMINIPKGLRDEMKKDFLLFSLKLCNKYASNNNDATKYLFRTNDGHFVETVLIKVGKRKTICISTQIGCKFNCSFCASGKSGFVRDLSCAEIIDQFLLVRNDSHMRITNIVFMGMGEPFDNYDNLIKTIKTFMADWGLAIGARRITISTVGLIPQIERFAREGFSQIKLSISLHAAFEGKRKQIMPIAHTYSLSELISTLRKVRDRFRRNITIEYILMKNFNDYDEDARALAAIAKQIKAKVNLIGYNAVNDCKFVAPSKNDLIQFRKKLEREKVQTTIRYSAGSDITAACGQLSLINKSTTVAKR
ncbi:MAG: 23S rRNA (adenine(2503)-C(2))-methyltransferase RlmN [Spirochaetes bacterium]|nr:MAG: 23S rRNA (adenine(2503)-C(2))-methyltransferase RlmN [Spirochaetota bacterium]